MALLKYSVVLCLFIYLPCVLLFVHNDGFDYEECPPDQKKCEYWLVIQEKLTMISEKNLVYAHKGKLYLFDEHPSNYSVIVSIIVI